MRSNVPVMAHIQLNGICVYALYIIIHRPAPPPLQPHQLHPHRLPQPLRPHQTPCFFFLHAAHFVKESALIVMCSF
jgi:hypothetical protein